jgi:hypothetical protein
MLIILGLITYLDDNQVIQVSYLDFEIFNTSWSGI